jgi:hypothetical protein
MYCKRCKVRMRQLGRTFHKQHKWVCPRCGRKRFSGAQYKRSRDGR